MKSYILTLCYIFLLITSKAYGNEFESDLKILLPTNHIAGGIAAAYGFLSPSLSNRSLYDRQIIAINHLGDSKSPCYATVLIPYLDYASSAGSVNQPPLRTLPVSQLCQDWPTFAALIKLSHSEKYISKYIKDADNPLDLRLTALLVLRYKNKVMYLDMKRRLLVELNNQSHIETIFKNMNNEEFCGKVDISFHSNNLTYHVETNKDGSYRFTTHLEK